MKEVVTKDLSVLTLEEYNWMIPGRNNKWKWLRSKQQVEMVKVEITSGNG